PGTERDSAKPLPRNRIGYLPAQRLITQPVAELQKHQPQVGLHRDRRPADPSIEVRHERREERRVVQQRIDPTQLQGATPTTQAAGSNPTTSADRLQYET